MVTARWSVVFARVFRDRCRKRRQKIVWIRRTGNRLPNSDVMKCVPTGMYCRWTCVHRSHRFQTNAVFLDSHRSFSDPRVFSNRRRSLSFPRGYSNPDEYPAPRLYDCNLRYFRGERNRSSHEGIVEERREIFGAIGGLIAAEALKFNFFMAHAMTLRSKYKTSKKETWHREVFLTKNSQTCKNRSIDLRNSRLFLKTRLERLTRWKERSV